LGWCCVKVSASVFSNPFFVGEHNLLAIGVGRFLNPHPVGAVDSLGLNDGGIDYTFADTTIHHQRLKYILSALGPLFG
jgi:hypothetical protein